MRRTDADGPVEKKLTFDKLVVNLDSYELIVDGVKVDTPPKEMELLYHLAASPNRVFTRNQLLDEVWGFDYFGDRGRFVFPVTLKADERLTCRDGRNWRVLAKPRRELRRGALEKPLPTVTHGREWRFLTEAPTTDDARVELVKRYRP